jgi:hypothetical protein
VVVVNPSRTSLEVGLSAIPPVSTTWAYWRGVNWSGLVGIRPKFLASGRLYVILAPYPVLLKRGLRGLWAVPGTVTTGGLNWVWLFPGTELFVAGFTASTLSLKGYMMKHSMRDLPLIMLLAHAIRNEKRMMVPTICFPVEELVVMVFLSFQDKKKFSFLFVYYLTRSVFF